MNNTYKMRKHGNKRHNVNNDIIKNKHASNSIDIPIWQKAALTVEEAAAYSNISSKTLRRYINECTPDFI